MMGRIRLAHLRIKKASRQSLAQTQSATVALKSTPLPSLPAYHYVVQKTSWISKLKLSFFTGHAIYKRQINQHICILLYSGKEKKR
jgi:hypothetical protein